MRSFSSHFLWAALLGVGLQTGALAQSFSDDFSDGDFSSNPSWQGHTALFTVNGSNELQLNNAGVAGTSYLSSAAQIQDSCRWEFYLRLNLAPSGSNYGRVYLQSDQAILTGSLNGYYLHVGESGSNDPIEIFKQTGTTRTSLFRGTLASMGANPAVARVRITRTAAGVWTVEADYTGGSNFSVEGTFTDNTHTIGTHLGVVCGYTSTNGTNFLFDDFFASPLFVDTQAPSLSSATAISGTAVDLYFDEPLQAASANNAANYSLDQGATVSAAALDGSDPRLVHLTTSALNSGSTYLATASNLSDLVGNVMSSDTASFSYWNVQAAVAGDIIISEIFADPTPVVGLPAQEYVELYNRSNKVIDLSTLVFNEGSTHNLGARYLLPGAYLILTANSSLGDFTAYPNVMGINSMALTNSGEALSLRTTGGTLIDSVFYSDAWYRDASKQPGGWSLELINPNETCKQGLNWIASNDASGGTPGQQNSVFSLTPDLTAPSLVSLSYLDALTLSLEFDEVLDPSSVQNLGAYSLSGGLSIASASLSGPQTVTLTLGSPMSNQTSYTLSLQGLEDCLGNASNPDTETFTYYEILPAVAKDLVFNEMMLDPTPVVGLPDAEYVEIYNRSSKAIQLNGLAFSHQSATSSTVSNVNLPSYLLLPNNYVVLHKSSQDSLFAACFNCLGLSLPDLNNTSASLVLRELNSGLVIDSLRYEASWYHDTNKDDGGWALEMINPEHSCKGGDNWRASVDANGGTPGYLNSVYDASLDTMPPTVLELRQFDNYQILLRFDEVSDLNALSNPSNYSIDGGLQVVNIQVLSGYTALLSLNGNMTDGQTYTLRLSNFADCLGNALQNTPFSFVYTETQTAARYDLIINEIMPDTDPMVGLPAVEWVELYNRSNKVLNLENYQFNDGGSVAATLPFYILQPGAYLLLCGQGDTAALSGFGAVLGLANFPDLNASGDDLTLSDDNQEILDAVFYRNDWFGNSSKASGGWTLERIYPNQPCQNDDNWRASENPLGGTPGAPNSLLQMGNDVQGPDLVRAFPLTADSLRLYFSESLLDSTGRQPLNFSINNGLQVVSAYLEPPFFQSVILRLDQPLQAGLIYTLRADVQVLDCVGNPMGLSLETPVALPQPIGVGDLLINEVLFNPGTGGSDFLELYNHSSKVVDLRDLLLANTASAGGPINQVERIETPYLVFPQTYVVLTPSRKDILTRYRVDAPFQVLENDLPSYADDEGTVVTYTTYQNIAQTVDSFYYLDDYHHALLDDKNGVSLERIRFEEATNNPSNWHSAAQSEGFATPARQNSAYHAEDINRSDWLDIPVTRLSPDGDGWEDFALMYYTLPSAGYVGDFWIYDAQGRLIKALAQSELLATEGLIQWDGSDEDGNKVLVGQYIFVAELLKPDGSRLFAKRVLTVAGKF